MAPSIFGRIRGYLPFAQKSGYAPVKDAIVAPSLFYISPIQLWIGPLISKVTKAATLEEEWLPEFAHSATALRDVFCPLKGDEPSIRSFLLQFETGGMLLLGAALEVCRVALCANALSRLEMALTGYL